MLLADRPCTLLCWIADNIYDNCPRSRAFLEETGLSMRQLYTALHEEKNSGGAKPAHLSLQALLGDDAPPIEADGPSGANLFADGPLMLWAFLEGSE